MSCEEERIKPASQFERKRNIFYFSPKPSRDSVRAIFTLSPNDLTLLSLDNDLELFDLFSLKKTKVINRSAEN